MCLMAMARHRDHPNQQQHENYHFFGVFDGHGCSHVAELCKERMHEIVAAELEQRMKLIEVETEMEKGWWMEAMEKCFNQMDKEAVASGSDSKTKPSPTLACRCRCELRMPRCNNVGSTATVAVVGPRHVVVANCGDSRAVLCRNGSVVPLSSDQSVLVGGVLSVSRLSKFFESVRKVHTGSPNWITARKACSNAMASK